jgi:ribosome recycling factor
MIVQETLKDTERRMKQAIEAMVHDFQTYRTGRANPMVLDRVKVDYYGVESPVNQIANISVPEPRQLVIQPYDKSSLASIEKAILKSDLGINPTNDGTVIRLNFPQMTEERRRDMVKQVNARGEQACVAIRNVRHHAIEQLRAAEKAKEISEDELKRHEQEVQKLTDKYVAEVHEIQKQKDAELMVV